MSKVFSIYSATIGGRLAEVREEKLDAKGNPYCMFIIEQQNTFKEEMVKKHWVKAWGKSKVKQIQEFPVGHNILVETTGEPYTSTYEGKTGTNLQLQATKIVYAGKPSGGSQQGYSQPQQSRTAQAPPPDNNDAPF